MLNDLIKKYDVSVYRISKDSGVPYTTLNELVNGKKDPAECSVRTIARLAGYFGLSLDQFYRQLLQEGASGGRLIADTWNLARDKKYRFPVVCATDGFDISRIHPLRQRAAVEVFNVLRGDRRVASAFIFGSSANIRCRKDSDLDLLVGLQGTADLPAAKDEVSEKLQAACGWNADILWADRVQPGSRLYENVMKGVRLI